MSKAQSTETKVADKLIEAMDNNWFNPSILARALVNNSGHYTQAKIMELVVEIIKQTAGQFDNTWEDGITSEALFMADRLNDFISNFEPIEA
jgi:hypothetical protein